MNRHAGTTFMPQADVAAMATVFVVDPDSAIRNSLEALICREGWRPRMLGSAEEFGVECFARSPSCIVSEVILPGSSGLELQERLAARPDIPLIFLTSHADISTTVNAMRGGAVEFLIKPIEDDVLVNVIRGALELSRLAIPEQTQLRTLCERYSALSPREQEVMALVVSGFLNKQVGARLGISEITVKAHRGKVMRKMRVGSLAQLVAMAAKLGVVTLSRGIAASESEPRTLPVHEPSYSRRWLPGVASRGLFESP